MFSQVISPPAFLMSSESLMDQCCGIHKMYGCKSPIYCQGWSQGGWVGTCPSSYCIRDPRDRTQDVSLASQSITLHWPWKLVERGGQVTRAWSVTPKQRTSLTLPECLGRAFLSFLLDLNQEGVRLDLGQTRHHHRGRASKNTGRREERVWRQRETVIERRWEPCPLLHRLLSFPPKTA